MEKPRRSGWAEVFVMAECRHINLTEEMKTARTRIRRGQSGQSLVEYALILVLVAIVAIVALFAVGLATQKGFGLVVGALGQKKDAAGAIVIDLAQCGVMPGMTGLRVEGTTSYDASQLTVSSTIPTVLDTSYNPIPLSSLLVTGGPGPFVWSAPFAMTADLGLCPPSIVIQSKDGAIAVSPLEVVVPLP